MSHLTKHRSSDGREVWVDAQGGVIAPVRSENSHEDAKEHRERQPAEAYAEYSGLDSRLLRRPADGRHDFDVVLQDGSTPLSIEVKDLTLPSSAMRLLDQTGEAFPSPSEFEAQIRTNLIKASVQLGDAQGAVKVILVVWSYEDEPSSAWSRWVRTQVKSVGEDLNIEEQVWITTQRARHFDPIR